MSIRAIVIGTTPTVTSKGRLTTERLGQLAFTTPKTCAIKPCLYQAPLFSSILALRQPIGYRVTLLRVADNQAISYEVFAEGWFRNGDAWGRPVDLLVLPDGSLLVSDDLGGVIYRITYSG